MTQPVTIPVDLDTTGVVQGANEAISSATALQAALAGVTIGAVATDRVLGNASSFGRRTLFGPMVSDARNYQQQLSGLAATSAVTGQSQRALSYDVQSLARQFPGGTANMIATVAAVQSLGLSSRQQVPQIRALSGEMVQLNAATGAGNVPMLATQFGQLNRQLASLDPTRLSRFGDVLTQLHADTGASATGMLSFASTIAPVAQQAGIGESAILGISSSFAKLGDDGGAAATAVNKILSDLNSSVRDGSNSMVAYANATGMTVKQFRALYQANPAQALTRVTQGIAKSGPGADYLLQSLGLDSTRTERALLELSQSGGLSSTISTAVGAYGNGSTQRAAAASFNNVNDQMQRLATTGGQLGEAFGAPVLRPMGAFLGIVQHLAAPLATIANSRIGQIGLQAGVLGGGAALLAGRGLLGGASGLTNLALARAAITSGPVAAAIAGSRVARYGEGAAFAGDSFMGRAYNPMILAGQTGAPMGRSLAGLNRGIFNFAYGLRGAGTNAADDIIAGSPGASTLGRIGSTALRGGGLGLQGYLRLARQPFALASQNAVDRDGSLTEPGGAFRTAGASMRTALGDRDLAGVGVAARTLTKDLMTSSTAMGGVTRSFMQYGAALGGFGLQTGVGAARIGGSLLGRAAGVVGGALATPLGIGAAAYAGYSIYSGARNYNNNQNNLASQTDIFATLNQYRDSLGEAGVATQTFADQVSTASQRVSATVTTQARARSFTPADVQSFGPPNPSKAIRSYAGNNAQIAAQISGTHLGGLQPQDLQAVKQDLYNQGFSPDRINSILGMVGSGGASSGLLSGIIGAAAGQAGQGNTGPGRLGGLGSLNSLKRYFGGSDNLLTGAESSNAWGSLGRSGGGHPDLTKTGQADIAELISVVGQTYAGANSQGKGRNYSTQAALQAGQKILNDAIASHNADLVVATEQQLTSALTGGKGRITGLSASDIQGLGGLQGVLASRNSRVYGQTIQQLLGEGVTFSGAGVAPARGTNNLLTALPGGQSNLFANLFAGGRSPGARAVSTAISQPENLAAENTAVAAMLSSLTGAGKSLNTIAATADQALGSTSGAQKALLAALLSQAQFRQGVAQGGMTQGGQLRAQIAQGTSLATVNGNDPTQVAQRQQGQQEVAQAQASERSYYQQRIMAQYSFQIQSERANYDYQLQVSRSEQDFQRQELRSQQDFQLQSLRSRADYNLSLKRQIQDASTQDYNPFSRIAAAPVFDAGTLETNLAEQNTAITTQTRNLQKARADGLSEAAIRTLGLSQTQNAQQLQQLIDDFANDPNVLAQINKTIAARGGDAGKLFKDPGNTTYARQKQDFDIAQARAQQDYAIARSRQEQDFQISLQRAAQDFNTQMTRMTQDLHTADLEVTGNMTQLHKDMIHILHGQTVDWSNSLTNTLSDTLRKLKGTAGQIANVLSQSAGGGGGGVNGNAGNGATLNIGGGISGHGQRTGSGPVDSTKTVTGPGGRARNIHYSSYVTPGTGSTTTQDLTDGELPDAAFRRAHPANIGFNKGIAKSMLRQTGWRNLNAQFAALDWIWGGHESGWDQYAYNPSDPDHTGQGAYGIPQSYPGGKMASDGKDWRTNPATQIKWGLEYIGRTYGDAVGAKNNYQLGKGYAAGGIAFGPQKAWVAEAGSPEAMIPLNMMGVKVLAGAMKAYIGADDAKMITTGGRAMSMSITNHYTYDSRTVVSGPITVEANNPAELGEKLAAKKRMDNLTAPKGVSTSVSS